VKRLFEPATYFHRNKRVQASWNIDRAERALAIAVYIFEKDVEAKPNCKQCDKSIGPTPGSRCIVPSGEILGGACTNCVYSGHRLACSFVRAIEREELAKKEAQKKNGELRPLTPELLRKMQFAELEVLLRILRNAIEERQEMIRSGQASRSTP
ncbi:hypothetical protein C7999DRAFT_15607, partial [Corynascus novoguineensis]